jgi:sigma-B regulation protein RsbU (phosphoserine phosphatase)
MWGLGRRLQLRKGGQSGHSPGMAAVPQPFIPTATPQSEDNSLALLVAMGRDFAQSRDVAATLARALERITEHVDAAGGALFLLSADGMQLRCEACVGASKIQGLTVPSDQGIVGRCVQQDRGEMVRDVGKDPDFYGKADQQSGFKTRSILCAPLSVQGEKLGAIELVNKRGGDGLFDDGDLNLLQGLSTSAALAILNARMAQELVEQERVKRELELAAEIQRTLLPAARPLPFPVHGLNLSAREVSGDFYDFFPLPDGRICFNVGDVSGKGMNAALLMAKTAALFRCLGKTIHEPGRLFAVINDEICETASRGMFVTMAGGLYDSATGEVRLVNAGHEPPLHRRADGSYADFPAEAPPLGIVPGGEFPEVRFNLEGGSLWIFTDGVTEGFIADGKSLGVEGVKHVLDEQASQPIDRRIEAVAAPLKKRAVLRDDVTLLAIEGGLSRTGRYPATAGTLAEIRGLVRETAAACGCTAAEAHDVVLAVDEACQNIVRHGYDGTPGGEIVVTVRREGDRIVVLLRDFAKAVDPAKIKPRDLDDLRPGGLGTHFIREVMDEVAFLPPPDGQGNLLRLAKRIG